MIVFTESLEDTAEPPPIDSFDGGDWMEWSITVRLGSVSFKGHKEVSFGGTLEKIRGDSKSLVFHCKGGSAFNINTGVLKDIDCSLSSSHGEIAMKLKSGAELKFSFSSK